MPLLKRIYAHLIRMPLVGRIFRLPVVLFRTLLGKSTDSTSDLRFEFMAASLDALRSDLDALHRKTNKNSEEIERLHLICALMSGKLEADSLARKRPTKTERQIVNGNLSTLQSHDDNTVDEAID